jgi:hypothetical protein
MTSQGHIGAQLQRAIQRRDLVDVESILTDMAFVPLPTARELVELYAEAGSPKYERAAVRYLERYLSESNPSLTDVAQVAALLAERAMRMRGL